MREEMLEVVEWCCSFFVNEKGSSALQWGRALPLRTKYMTFAPQLYGMGPEGICPRGVGKCQTPAPPPPDFPPPLPHRGLGVACPWPTPPLPSKGCPATLLVRKPTHPPTHPHAHTRMFRCGTQPKTPTCPSWRRPPHSRATFSGLCQCQRAQTGACVPSPPWTGA